MNKRRFRILVVLALMMAVLLVMPTKIDADCIGEENCDSGFGCFKTYRIPFVGCGCEFMFQGPGRCICCMDQSGQNCWLDGSSCYQVMVP